MLNEKNFSKIDLMIRCFERALIDKHGFVDKTRIVNEDTDGGFYAVLVRKGVTSVSIRNNAPIVDSYHKLRIMLMQICELEKDAQKRLDRTLEDIICFGDEDDALCLSCGLTEYFGDDVILAAERLCSDTLIDKDNFSFSWITEHEIQYKSFPDEWLMFGLTCKNCKCEIREPRGDIAWFTFDEAQNDCGEMLAYYIDNEGISIDDAPSYVYAVQYDGFESDKIVNMIAHKDA
jgi:hypothetical protein